MTNRLTTRNDTINNDHDPNIKVQKKKGKKEEEEDNGNIPTNIK